MSNKHITKTRANTKMNPILKQRLINLLIDPENDGLSQKKIAEKLKISTTTVRNYMTAELLEYVRQQRLQHSLRLLAAVDHAMLEKASKGDVNAAKLVYSRWEAQQQAQPKADQIDLPETEDELDALIQKLLAEVGADG